jgi:hypothetical protein
VISKEVIIMKTIQITLIDELHQRSKAAALANRLTLKQFIADAIEAHVVRLEAMTPPAASAGANERGAR